LAVGNCPAAQGAWAPTGRRGAVYIVAAARLQLVERLRRHYASAGPPVA